MKADKITLVDSKLEVNVNDYNKLVISCDNIYLEHNSLGMLIPIPNEKIERFEKITINGITFKKEK